MWLCSPDGGRYGSCSIALGFGLTQGLQFLAAQVTCTASVPTQFWVALPYIVTVMAVVFAPGSTYPAAVGIPYRRAGS